MTFVRAASILFLLGAASFAHAQSYGAEPITISVSPMYPEPYQTVTVTPGSTLLDLAAYTVTVSVNGQVINTGTGTESSAFQARGSGEVSTIKVTASGPEGTFERSVTIRPSSVSLVVEPVSVTHPLYEGASLLAPEGRVRLIAIADLRGQGGAVSPQNLVYTWKAGDQVLQAQSGIGRSVLTATAPLQYRDADITVTVSTQDGSASGQAYAQLTPVEPFVRIYRNSPLEGPDFDTALVEEFTMTGDEESFRAIPYYFSALPAFSWAVNGAVSGSEQVITVRTNGDGPGAAVLSVDATQPGTYAAASASLGIRFGGEDTIFDFFGLL